MPETRPPDWRELFKKYLAHIMDEEGTDYLYSLSYTRLPDWTTDEVEAVSDLANEAWDDINMKVS